jgi:hypothetical protein
VIVKHAVPWGSSSYSRLVNYMTQRERAEWLEITNCRAGDVEGAVAEVLETQALNRRAKSDRTMHLVFSFAPGEQPPRETVRAIESHMVAALGLSDHQRISAWHQDKEHGHLHTAINLIHPERHTITVPWRSHWRLMRAASEMEREHALVRTPHSLWERLGMRWLGRPANEPEETVAPPKGRNGLSLQDLMWEDYVPSGWRKLVAADIARRENAAYAAAEGQGRDLAADARRAERSLESWTIEKEVAQIRQRERRQEIGLLRTALHIASPARLFDENRLWGRKYLFGRDLELLRWETNERISDKLIERTTLELAAIGGRQKMTARMAAAELRKVEDKAQPELAQRRTVAEGARRQLSAEGVYPYSLSDADQRGREFWNKFASDTPDLSLKQTRHRHRTIPR